MIKAVDTSSKLERKGYFPLSFEQERMWFLDRLDPGNPAYNIRGAVRVQGDLNLKILGLSLAKLVERHEILRTTFEEINGQVQQKINPPFPVTLKVADLRSLPLDEREGEAKRLATQLVGERFNLNQAPPWKLNVLQLEAQTYWLVLTIHHIICDGDWSIRIFFQELGLLHEEISQGKVSTVPELKIQYRDFALDQRERESDIFESQRSYWLEKLGDHPAPLQLPYDHPRPAVQTYRGASSSCIISPKLTEQLKYLSQQQGVSLFLLLLAAFKVILYRCTQQEDICVGTPVAGRHGQKEEELIGYFGNPIVLRSHLSGNPRFCEFLAHVAQVVSLAQQNQDYPFQKLVEELKLERDLSYSPLFQVLFLMRDELMPVLELPSLTITPIEIPSEAVPYDWFVSLWETEEGLEVLWEYNADLFEEESINLTLHLFEHLLVNIVKQPDTPIGEISLLTPREREKLLKQWNQTQRDYPQVCTHQLMEIQADKTPNAIAVSGDFGQLTYQQLNVRANQLGHYLQKLGVKPNQLVGVFIERSPWIAVAILGILKAGGAYVPLDPSYPQERLNYILDDTNLDLVLTTEISFSQESGLWKRKGKEKIICVDQNWEAIATETTANVDSYVGEDNLAYIIYTSGSTGKPKGVMMTHNTLTNMLTWHRRERIIGAKTLQFAPISFDMSFHEMFSTWQSGGEIILISEELRRDPIGLLELIDNRGIEKLYLPFVALQQLAEVAQQRPVPKNLREVMTAGEKVQITPAIASFCQRTGCSLHNHYGSTECPEIASFSLTGDPQFWSKLPPVGFPIDNVQVYILDKFLAPVPIGVPGELYVAGKGMAKGYFNLQGLTQERFIPNKFGDGYLYKTGDLARYRSDGTIEHLGRADRQVKIRGFRIELGEIESLLAQDPQVEECAVIVREDVPGDRKLVAYIVATQSPTRESLRAKLRNYCQQNLPKYMVPAAIVILEQFPLTPSGKLDRRSLPAPNRNHFEGKTEITLPNSQIEQSIASIWQEVLRLDSVGVKDNFFDLGGNSLLLIQVHQQLVELLETELATITLFQYPTIQSLAKYLGYEQLGTGSEVEKKAPLERNRSVNRGDIAIVGLAGRFPGASTIEEFWQNLCAGVESITTFADDEIEVDNPRLVKEAEFRKVGAVLNDIDSFDAEFFGYSAREAELLDPQQRIFLECAWEALENAGYQPKVYDGEIGVFAGSGLSTYLINNLYSAEGYSPSRPFLEYNSLPIKLGNERNYLPTRISYKLNLTGPSVNVQTACSTSLVAVHLASQSLRMGECDLALAGGVSIVVPQKVGYLYREGMIHSPDGHCRAFDHQARGTVFGNGAGVIVLKRLEDALAAGDNIYAVIKGSAINNDGAVKVGYTAPSVEGQAKVVSRALAEAGVDATSISYVEAHGTATPLGDPIEVAALTQAFNQNSPTAKPGFCALASVKTNIGHLDEAAGIAGLIKTALALKHQLIPPSLHYQQPNPNIDFSNSPFYVNTKLTPWDGKGMPRRAGVSSFGMGGTNCHIVLEEAPTTANIPHSEQPWHILTLSAKSNQALQEMLRRYLNHLEGNGDGELPHICFTTNVGREHFPYRSAIVANSKEKLQEQLEMLGENRSHFPGSVTPASLSQEIAFLFTGQGSQYVGMGYELYKTQPVFQEAIDKCHAFLKEEFDISLVDILYPESEAHSPSPLINETAFTQPALFSFEYALAQLWLSWGIRPQVMIGHSIGEYVAACIAGVFSLETGLRLIATRGRLMQALPPEGEMVALLATEQQVKSAIAPYSQDISLAAINGPQSMVISGRCDAIQAVCQTLEAQGIKTKKLPVSHAFHSPLMEPMLAEFAEIVCQMPLAEPQIEIISSVTGASITTEITTPEYWCRQIRQPVQFAASMVNLEQRGTRVLIEIGAKPILLAMAARQCVGEDSGVWLPSVRPESNDWQELLTSLGKIYELGIDIDWLSLHRHHSYRRQPLPSYPFQRQQYWINAPKTQETLPTAFPSTTAASHPLLGQVIPLASSEVIHFQSQISKDTPSWLKEHRVFDAIVVPGTAYLEMGLAAGENLIKEGQSYYLEGVRIEKALVLPEDGDRQWMQLVLTPEEKLSYTWKIFSCNQTSLNSRSNWELHVSGEVKLLPQEAIPTPPEWKAVWLQNGEDVDIKDFYQQFRGQCIDYGANFQAVRKIQRGLGAALGQIKLAEGLKTEGTYQLHPILLDACLQVLDAAISTQNNHQTYVPVGLEKMWVYSSHQGSQVWCYAYLHSQEDNLTTISADLQLFDENKQAIALIEGLRLKAVPKEIMLGTRQQPWQDWLYQIQWETQSLESISPNNKQTQGEWLIFADRQGLGEEITLLLTSSGAHCNLVFAHETYQRIGVNQFQISPNNPEDFQQLLRVLPEIKGVVNLWSLDTPLEFTTRELETVCEINCGSAIYLVQALSKNSSNHPSLWWILRGAQAVNYFPVTAVASGSLGGTLKVIALEHPEFNSVTIDLDPKNQTDEAQAIFEEIISTSSEDQIAYREGQRYVPRLIPYRQSSTLTVPPSLPYQLQIHQRGTPESLELETNTRRPPQGEEVEIRVHTAGLNFIDVLNVLDLYPGNPPLGIECSGEIVAVGSEVKDLGIGDQIIALGTSTFAKYVTINHNLVIPKPEKLHYIEAATIPVSFVTAYWCLHHLANISAGDKVMIHAASGGVGQAAVQIALQAGAEVFATASPSKWHILDSLGVQHIMNSRTLDFATEVMERTNNQGVDVVLNSLTGEGFIEKSLSVLARGGHFVEIAKREIWSREKFAQVRGDVSYDIVDIGEECQQRPQVLKPILYSLRELFCLGSLQPLPQKTFPLQEAISAFRYMQQAKQIGKIVLEFPQETSLFRGDRNYLIAGGLGDLGLAVADWMVESGARFLTLVGRHQPDREVTDNLAVLEQKGAKITTIAGDISNLEQVKELFAQIDPTLPPLSGVFHTAGLLDDGIIQQQTWDRFARVMAPKVAGAWNLHLMTRDRTLDFFVLFSSISSLLGNPGQANYSAANAFLDNLASYRQNQGLPGLSINWGAWAEIGMSARLNLRERLEQQGEGSITPQQGLEALGWLMERPSSQVGVMPMDWRVFAKKQLSIAPFLSNLVQTEELKQSPVIPFQQRLATLPPREQRAELVKQVCRQIGLVLRISSWETIPLKQRFIDLGLDSLMAIELKSQLQSSLGCSLSTNILFNYPTLGELVDYLSTVLGMEPEKDRNLETKQVSASPTLIAIQPQGTQPILFFLPGILGNVFDLSPLARTLGFQQPFYGLRSLGLEEGEKPLTDLKSIAIHHLHTIQNLQPEGPYFLGGHSFGGRVAFELAQQLQQLGEQVASVLLLDTWGNPLERYQNSPTWSDEQFIEDLSQFYGNILSIPRESIAAANSQNKLEQLQRQLALANLQLTSAEMERSFQVYKANAIADAEYEPQELNSVPIHLFQAGEIGKFNFLPDAVVTSQDLTWGWGDRISGTISVHTIPGNHFTMISEPHVQVLAQQIKHLIKI